MLVVRRLTAVLVLATAVATLLLVAPAGAQTTTPRCTSFTALKPSNEVRTPPVTDPVESKAFGFALVRIRGTTLHISVVIVNLAGETFTAGHIHEAAAGANGPIVVPLFSGSSNALVFTQFDSLQIDPTLAARICGNLAGFYVNYHTTQDPQGATRGQLG
jgi:CHRD domain